MSKNSTKIAKIIISFFIFLFAIIISISNAYAFDAPRIYVKELNISQTSFSAGNTISGNFLMWNTSGGIAADLSYAISLNQGDSSLDKQIYPVSGQIAPTKTLSQAFSYVIPKNIPNGDYQFKIQIFSQSGMPLNWGTKSVKITGGSGYLNIAGSYVVRGEKAFDPTIGPTFKAGESVKIKFVVYNPVAQKIDFKPQVTIYPSQDNTKELEHFSGSVYSLEPKGAKNVEIDMPKYKDAGSYLAKVVLLSQNDPVSGEVTFRWVVAGSGAKILNVLVKSNILEAGKGVEASVDYTGPADSTDVGEAKLVIDLYNAKNGQIVASGEKTIQLGKNAGTEVFSLIPSSNAESFTAEVKITKDGKELASYSANIKNPKDTGDKGIMSASNLKIYLILSGILMVVLIILLRRKNMIKGKKLLLLFVIFVGAGILIAGATDVRAASTCAEGDGCLLGCSPTPDVDCSTLNLTWNAPMLDTVYVPGNPITYEGVNNNLNCFNNVGMLEAKSFVCDIDKLNCIQNGSERKYIAESSKMAYDPDDGKLYVLDSEDGNARIIRVDPVTKIQEAVLSGEGANGATEALGLGLMHKPEGIFYSSPYLYIADTGNNKVARVKPADLNTPANWTVWEASFNAPWGIVFKSPYIYVADSGNNRVVRFDGLGGWDQYDGSATGTVLNNPGGISSDGTYIYVADTGNNRVVRFKPDTSGGNSWQVFTTDGFGVTLDGSPRDVFYSSPNLYVMDTFNARVVMFNPNIAGAWTTFGSGYGSDVGKFGNANGIFYLAPHIYVGDGWNFKRIVRFDPSNMVGTWDVFEFSPKAYNINTNVPLAVGDPSFAKGDGGVNPLGAVYAKVSSHVEYVIGATDDAESFERIIIDSTPPAGTCPGFPTVTDARDGHVYDTVQIGNQCWMKQNMEIGTKIKLCQNNVTPPAGQSCKDIGSTLRNQANNSQIEKYCYDDSDANCADNGGLYQWAEAMQLPSSCSSSDCSASISSPHQGICPAGWHIPTDAEQHALELFLTNPPASSATCDPDRGEAEHCDAAGAKLKAGGSSGFEGILNGYTNSPVWGDTDDGKFMNIGWTGGFYSATQNGVDETWHRHLNSPSSTVFRHSGPKYYSDGVRCIKDGSAIPNNAPSVTLNAVSIPNYCDTTKSPADINLSWTFSDIEDGATQTAYRLKIIRDGSWIYDSGKTASSSTSLTAGLINLIPGYAGFISYNHSYTWEITVWDSANVSNGPKAGAGFTTPVHMYPTADFFCSPSAVSCPANHSAFEPIDFTNDSICYNSSNNPIACSSLVWNFGDGSPLDTTAAPSHSYAVQGNYSLSLTASDGTYSCPKGMNMNIGPVSPRWKEVIPKY